MNWTHVSYAQELRFGSRAIEDAGRALEALGARRVLLITTSRGRESASGQRLARSLGGALVAVFDGARPHVPQGVVRSAHERLRSERIDAIVSFGGGSCSDLGKAVCYFEEQQGEEPGTSCFDRPAVPHATVPTTYSGAELTPFFGMMDETARRKSGFGGPTIAPAIVLYDPQVTLDLPPRVSAETGMNALAHCVEAAWSPARTVEAEAIALAGAAQIYRWLPRVVEHPQDLEARTAMLAGAMLAGRALQNASMGVHHGLAQMVGARTGIPHGLANALILAHAAQFNADAVPDAMGRLAAAFGRRDGDAVRAIDDLRARLGLPAHLSDCGVSAEDVEVIARLSAANTTLAKNPKRVREADARAILAAAL
ncbi:MAG TPA: iron-containing alcohol dehydrogenase [Steroidobacteraceae bacterium]|nr:iron-containing alcohol dehydrogenase [Steroidobacteraceae bacterium]